ncbi:Altered inheritance of mitochondria protein 24, mitochondrial [Nakaseomyces bracarensis]|uniref:Altered inheritance of mitochondria protein 24, mitochondrial n=1 Tax=Nakaseomyces bracarensis TaxID=273131 RepID=A0ABR4NQ43_9SACH
MLKKGIEVLGRNSLAMVPLEPSVPVYVRKGCLVSLRRVEQVVNVGESRAVLSHRWVNFWSNLARFRSWNVSLYHTVNVTGKNQAALVAPNVASRSLLVTVLKLLANILAKDRKGITVTSPTRTVYPLELDGTQDWDVWGRDSIIAFEGNESLSVKPAPLTKSIFGSRKNYQVITGRGNAILSGYGNVYAIDLNTAEDDVVINTQNVLAVSGTSQLDISNAISENPFLISYKDSTVLTDFTPNLESVEKQSSSAKAKDQVLGFTKGVCNWISFVYKKTVIYSNNNGQNIASPAFVRIQGPRTVIMQTSHETNRPVSVSTVDIIPRTIEHSIPEADDKQEEKATGYFSYAEVGADGKVRFRSVSDFSESING